VVDAEWMNYFCTNSMLVEKRNIHMGNLTQEVLLLRVSSLLWNWNQFVRSEILVAPNVDRSKI
jgi:hypothetical protein